MSSIWQHSNSTGEMSSVSPIEVRKLDSGDMSFRSFYTKTHLTWVEFSHFLTVWDRVAPPSYSPQITIRRTSHLTTHKIGSIRTMVDDFQCGKMRHLNLIHASFLYDKLVRYKKISVVDHLELISWEQTIDECRTIVIRIWNLIQKRTGFRVGGKRFDVWLGSSDIKTIKSYRLACFGDHYRSQNAVNE